MKIDLDNLFIHISNLSVAILKKQLINFSR